MKKFVVAYDHIQKDLVIIPLIQYRPQRKIQEYRSRYEPVDSADTVLEAQAIMQTVKNMGVSEYLKKNSSKTEIAGKPAVFSYKNTIGSKKYDILKEKGG